MPDESALHYDRLVREAGGLAPSHRWLVSRVPRGATVLDCGCAGGFIARALTDGLGCTVDGAELDEAAASAAAAACRRVYIGSLEDANFIASLGDGYDRVIFGDVLEHLRDPGRVLRLLAPRLADGGRVLISVPNVAYWSIRLHLLVGRFEYRDAGILDRTHLRFFTYRTAKELVEDAGYRIVRQEFTCRVPPVPVVFGVLCAGARLLPNLFAYQTLIEAEPCRE